MADLSGLSLLEVARALARVGDPLAIFSGGGAGMGEQKHCIVAFLHLSNSGISPLFV